MVCRSGVSGCLWDGRLMDHSNWVDVPWNSCNILDVMPPPHSPTIIFGGRESKRRVWRCMRLMGDFLIYQEYPTDSRDIPCCHWCTIYAWNRHTRHRHLTHSEYQSVAARSWRVSKWNRVFGRHCVVWARVGETLQHFGLLNRLSLLHRCIFQFYSRNVGRTQLHTSTWIACWTICLSRTGIPKQVESNDLVQHKIWRSVTA